MPYLTKDDIDFESSPEDLITFMANKDTIAADREAIVHFSSLGYTQLPCLKLWTFYTLILNSSFQP